jgi:hypothetical protein
LGSSRDSGPYAFRHRHVDIAIHFRMPKGSNHLHLIHFAVMDGSQTEQHPQALQLNYWSKCLIKIDAVLRLKATDD